MKINKEWHLANKMPKNATPEERFAWHVEHSKNCSCRKMPTKLAEILKNEVDLPLMAQPFTDTENKRK